MTDSKTEEKVVVPVKIVEALLANVAGGDWGSVHNIVQEIREVAQDQAPDRFPK